LWREQTAALELAALLASPVYYGVGVPRGDGTPAVLVPGFLGADDYLTVMYGWLRRIGYRPHASGLVCVGSVDGLAARLLHRVERVAADADRKVILIGHSLGGMLSCAVALKRPDLVEHVVTLGSARTPAARAASDPIIGALAEVFLPRSRSADDELEATLGMPLPEGVRLTCIFSRDDAVVHWRACLDDDPRTAAHEVRGSHTGLAWNAHVYHALGRLLAHG